MSLDATFADANAAANPTTTLKSEDASWKSHFNHGLNAVFGIGTKVAGLATAAAIVPSIAVGVPGAALAAGLVFGATHIVGSLTKAQYEFEAREDARATNPALPSPSFVNIAGRHLASPF